MPEDLKIPFEVIQEDTNERINNKIQQLSKATKLYGDCYEELYAQNKKLRSDLNTLIACFILMLIFFLCLSAYIFAL